MTTSSPLPFVHRVVPRGSRWLAPLLIVLVCLMEPRATARLPHPIKLNGIVLKVDLEKRTLIFKEPKGKKPFLLDWNKDTEFSRKDQPATAADLKEGIQALIVYRDVTFRHCLLLKVIWTDPASKP